MAAVNIAIVLGNLGKDPETRYSQGGDAVCNFSLATTEKWTNKEGGKEERTTWHNIVLFGRQAEVAGEYLNKGDPVFIRGKLQTRKYTDKQGVDKYVTEIVGEQLQLLGSRKDAGGGEKPERQARAPAKPEGGAAKKNVDDFDDDIPFVFNDLEVENISPLQRRMHRSSAR